MKPLPVMQKEYWLSVLLILIVTSAVYSPVLTHQFVEWDDKRLLEAVWSPSWQRAWRIVSDFQLQHSGEVYYTPLSLLSLMLDQVLVGAQERPVPWISKLINLSIHVGNSIIVFTLLLAVGVSRRASLIGALVFGIHPLQVGTVAWVTERKNLLVAFFYLSTLLVYLKYLASGKIRLLPLVGAFFFAALLSKPSAVTLPVALLSLLLTVGSDRVSWRRETIFVLLLVAVSSAYGVHVLSTEKTFHWILPSWQYRPLIAAGAIWFYIGKFVWPVGLVPLYERWDVVAHPGWFVFMLVAFLAAAGLIIAFRRRISRWVLWGLFFFLLNLILVLGFIPFGYLIHSYVADHFLYLPMVGLVLVVAKGSERLFNFATPASKVGTGVMVALYGWLCILGLVSIRQTEVWKDSASVWETTLRTNPDSVAALNNYGLVLMKKGKFDKALEIFHKAATLAPTMDKPFHNMGAVHELQGNKDEARQMYAKAARLDPRNAKAPIFIARILRSEGKSEEAIDVLERAIARNSQSAVLRQELGVCLYEAARVDEALRQLDNAIALNRLLPGPYVKKGIIFLERGDPDGAMVMARTAIEVSETAQAYNLLGAVHASKGDLRSASLAFLDAYRLQPALPGIRDNLANALIDSGSPARAHFFCQSAAKAGYPCGEQTLKRIRALTKTRKQ